MKKYFSRTCAALLAVSLLFTQLLIPVAALETAECTCDAATRTGTVISTVDATCDSYGYEMYECDECHGTYMVLTTVPTGAHSYVDYAAQAPDCTEIGWEAYKVCSVCGDSTYVELPALGHDYQPTVTDPDCVNDGFTTHTCSRCSDAYTDTPVDALGHTAGSAVEENRVDADCENDGSYDSVIYCTVCSEEFVRTTITIDALGHDYQEVNRVEATCVTDGYIDYECSVCSATKQEVLTCVGHHDYVKTITDATCDTASFATYTCQVATCGYTFTETIGEPLGHTEVVDEAVEPTCTETGLTEGKHCEVCDAVIVAQTTVAALGHDYVATVTDPTCSAQGYTTHTCSVCDDSYVDTYVDPDPLSHRGVITKNEVKATCTETGLTYEIACGDCGIVLATQKTTPKDPANHDYIAEVTDPTCTDDGYTTHTCSRCDDSYQDTPVAALGHDLTQHDAQDPTCTEIGWDAYEDCSRCNYTTYVEKAATGHSYNAVVTDPTCTEQGFTTHTCSACDDSYVDTYVDALGHNSCETLGKVDPTCTEKGYTVKKCLVCETVFKDDFVDELGHDLTQHDAQAPTCTDIGWDAYEDCSRCDYTTYVEKAALGHRLERYLAKPATCTEAGYTDHLECAFCDYTTLYFDIAPLGHDLTHHDAQDPTCTEIGWDAYDDCSRCDYTTYVEKAATGHSTVQVDALDATCTEDGHNAHEYCENCDYTTKVVAPALGHDIIVDEAVAPTYDSTGLTEGEHCSRCDEATIAQTVVDALSEDISFTYEISGVNSDVAVNSGYITLKVYMNVNSDFARLYGVDFKLAYNENLSLKKVEGCIFSVSDSTKPETADETHVVALSQSMGYQTDKEFAKGEYLFATLTFKVADDFFYQDAAITVVGASGSVARDDELYVNELVADYGTGAIINVAKLGDANEDGDINSKDVLAFSKWFSNALLEDYNHIYDMNKDGYVDGDDFVLLRGAVVGNNDYLKY